MERRREGLGTRKGDRGKTWLGGGDFWSNHLDPTVSLCEGDTCTRPSVCLPISLGAFAFDQIIGQTKAIRNAGKHAGGGAEM
eukprot:17772-Hanusia_phi.AAC.1